MGGGVGEETMNATGAPSEESLKVAHVHLYCLNSIEWLTMACTLLFFKNVVSNLYASISASQARLALATEGVGCLTLRAGRRKRSQLEMRNFYFSSNLANLAISSTPRNQRG